MSLHLSRRYHAEDDVWLQNLYLKGDKLALVIFHSMPHSSKKLTASWAYGIPCCKCCTGEFLVLQHVYWAPPLYTKNKYCIQQGYWCTRNLILLPVSCISSFELLNRVHHPGFSPPVCWNIDLGTHYCRVTFHAIYSNVFFLTIAAG